MVKENLRKKDKNTLRKKRQMRNPRGFQDEIVHQSLCKHLVHDLDQKQTDKQNKQTNKTNRQKQTDKKKKTSTRFKFSTRCPLIVQHTHLHHY